MNQDDENQKKQIKEAARKVLINLATSPHNNSNIWQDDKVPKPVMQYSTCRRDLLTEHIKHKYKLQFIHQSATNNIGPQYNNNFQPTFGPIELHDPANRLTIPELMSWKYIGKGAVLGKYFVCRTIAWPVHSQDNCIKLVVEDPDEDECILLCLYNWLLDEEMDPRVIPIGTTLVVKNPWIKVLGYWSVGIRVDNPAEVEIFSGIYPSWGPLDLSINHEFGEETPGILSANEYKAKGDEYFIKGKLHSAIRSYTFGILLDQTIAELWIKRSFCYLKVGKPIEALKDSESALALNPGNTNAIHRKALALARLNKHAEAIDLLKSQETNTELQNLEKSLSEKAILIYFDQHFKKQPALGTHLNYPEFCGAVKVVQIPGKGRGIIVTENFKKKSLLFSCRAFDMFVDHNISKSCRTHSQPSYEKLLTSIALRLKEEPQLMTQLYQLYAGDNYEALDPSLDPISNKKAAQQQLLVDMDRIDKLLFYNSFNHERIQLMYSENQSQTKWSGLWILPSFINHSCKDANVDIIMQGDFMFIVTREDLAPGTELLMSYFENSGKTPYAARKKRIWELGFSCICRVCKQKR